MHKYNLSRKHNVGGICNPYNPHYWKKPEIYAKYANDNSEQVVFNHGLYSRKLGS